MEQGSPIFGGSIELVRTHGLKLAGLVVIAVAGWMAAAWAARTVRSLGRRSAQVDATLVPVLASVSRLFILTITAMAGLEWCGIDTKSLFAVLGAAGLTVGLALKDTLADVAAGIVLLVLRPFDVGDAVDVDGTAGIVDAIDVFQTKLTSFDGVPIVLPNSKVRAAKIQNFTRSERRRMELTIGVGNSADVTQAIEALWDILANEPRVLAEPGPSVDVVELVDQKVNLLVRAWTLPADFFPVRLELTRQIKHRLHTEGICVPTPQRELHIVPRSTERSP